MANKLDKIFKKENNIVIGMVHFPPLLGYEDFPGREKCLEKSLNDAKILEHGGVDSVLIENNYDIPHKEFISKENVSLMTFLAEEISKSIDIPLGVNVLWNDYKAALLIAKAVRASFIRVPVFVDSVKTDYGKIFANPENIISFRKEIETEDILLFTDIHPKHAKMLQQKSISESALEAVEKGSNALILTGEWTGDAPSISNLKETRIAVGENFPILVGSGATKDNVGILLKYADGVIVGTSLKTGLVQAKEKEVNLKPWQERISLEKTKEFVEKVHNS